MMTRVEKAEKVSKASGQVLAACVVLLVQLHQASGTYLSHEA